MKRSTLAVLAFLAFGTCAEADSLLVTSGVIQVYGPGAPTASLSGAGFTASGVMFFTGACPNAILPGQQISGCAGFDFISGALTVVMNGVTRPVEFGNNVGTTITQAPMFLSGVTQATLSEPATIGPLVGCDNAAAFPACTETSFVITGDVLFTISLLQNPFTGGYDVTSETYTITTPEPGTLLLLGAGFAAVGLWKRRFLRALPNH